MSATKQRIPLKAAQTLAERVAGELAGCCQRVEIAGSIRRRRPSVGDVELLVVPMTMPAGLFEDPAAPRVSLLDGEIAWWVDTRRAERLKDGPRYKQLLVGSDPAKRVTLDLWITEPDCWGVQLMIRTGSAAFANAAVTPRDRRTRTGRPGLLRPDLTIHERRVWRAEDIVTQHLATRSDNSTWHRFPREGAVPLETPEEADVFELLGGWVEPEERE